MALSPVRHVPYEAKTVNIRVYSYEGMNIVGAINNTELKTDYAFSNLTEMVFQIESILDNLQFPQVTFDLRTFDDQKKTSNYHFTTDENSSKKTIASFRLNVMYRQNASWQGDIFYIDENKTAKFRSLLELIHLLDSVLRK